MRSPTNPTDSECECLLDAAPATARRAIVAPRRPQIALWHCGALLLAPCLITYLVVRGVRGARGQGRRDMTSESHEHEVVMASEPVFTSPSAFEGQIRHAGGGCLRSPALAKGAVVELANCSRSAPSVLQAWRYDGARGWIVSDAGLCLDASGRGMHLQKCSSRSDAQVWRFEPDSGHMVNGEAGRCLSTTWHDSARVKGLFLQPCATWLRRSLQQWSLGPASPVGSELARQIRLGDGSSSGACLRVHGDPAAVGARVALAPCEDPEHEWMYSTLTRQVRAPGGLCLTPLMQGVWGSRLQLDTCHGEDDASQRFGYWGSGQLTAEGGGLCAEVSGAEIRLWGCSAKNPGQRWEITMAVGRIGPGPAPPTKTTTPAPPSTAPLLEYFVYRAAPAGQAAHHPFGNVNAANMPGVIWYLMNEVVTEYTQGMACPRKFGIAELRRFKVRTRATQRLYEQGHKFGARFAYDRGQCVGRCFPGNECTCSLDCDEQYAQYGHVVGCNNFRDHYPFPAEDTQAPDGIWYSFPAAGRCADPTGDPSCTWSIEEAGGITLAELEALEPGKDQCCDGACTDFWSELFDPARTAWRVHKALALFRQKYPDEPRDLTVPCDFNRSLWYAEDSFKRRNPWDMEDGCMKERFITGVAQPYR